MNSTPTIKTNEEFNDLLLQASKEACKDPEIDAAAEAVFWASSSNTWFVYCESKRGNFNAFAFDTEDGQIYHVSGPAPKRQGKGFTYLVPSNKVRRGKPIGTRNVLTDAVWAMKTGLETRGTFIRILGVTGMSVTSGGDAA
jgi:hypothetical protein